MGINAWTVARASFVGLWLAWTNSASAYLANGHWSTTATDGPTAPVGRPITLTWSIVPDGTTITHLSTPGNPVPSNLVSVFDGVFPGSSGVALEEKPWYLLIEQCFARWSAVSGLTFVYEPADDGVSAPAGHPQGNTSWPGQLGVRGDIRLGGATIPTLGTLASTGPIPNGDITFDTSETAYYGTAGGDFPYINLRTTLMHEIGHSLGLGHIDSNNAAFLMEDFSQDQFDGPQFDDIRGAHHLYGDFHEKSNAGSGNESIGTATPLGALSIGQSVAVGLDATTSTIISSDDTDFVSITDASDLDFFSFTTEEPSQVDVLLTPIGPNYRERIPPFAFTNVVGAALSNLSLQLFASDGGSPVLLASQDVNGLGQGESILDFQLDEPGSYFVRIAGNTAAVQFYRLAIDVAAAPLHFGDFNDDGHVDAADYTVWRNNLGSPDDEAIHGYGDGVPGISFADYDVWRAHFGESFGPGGQAAQVPEPALASLLVAGGVLLSGASGRPTGGRVGSKLSYFINFSA